SFYSDAAECCQFSPTYGFTGRHHCYVRTETGGQESKGSSESGLHRNPKSYAPTWLGASQTTKIPEPFSEGCNSTDRQRTNSARRPVAKDQAPSNASANSCKTKDRNPPSETSERKAAGEKCPPEGTLTGFRKQSAMAAAI